MKRLHISASWLIIILTIYFGIVLNQTLWLYVINNTDWASRAATVSVILLPIFILFPLYLLFNVITVPYLSKIVIPLLLILSAITDYATYNLGIVPDSTMMRNLIETNTREALDLITPSAIGRVLITGIIPAILLILTEINYRPFKKETKTRLSSTLIFMLIVALLLPISYKEYVTFGRNHKMVRHYINTFSYMASLSRYYERNHIANHEFIVLDKAPKRMDIGSKAPRVLVYFVGETARAENFSLYGYERETNPMLKQEDLIIFKNTVSCGTATTVSLPCMFSHLSRQNFKLSSASYTQNLIDIVHASGYDVFWKENDDGCKNICSRVPNVDARKGNKKPYCFGRYCHDDILINDLEKRLSAITKDTVIVLHMMGSHGPTYYKRYPKAFDKFSPACNSADLHQCSREQIVNTYDNTILYTDYIVATAINILKKHNEFSSAVLYVSDHGESLGENNLYLHSLPYAIAPQAQKQIPMLLWLSENIKNDLNINEEKLKQNAATKSFSHDNLFHSILHLLSVKTTVGAGERQKLNIFE